MAAIHRDQGWSRHEWRHDVFVSFRGEELRNSFASHLFRAMDRVGIDCFRDDDEREVGEKIHPKLVDAIRRSRFSLALFSPRYGESRWCLNELVEMLDFHEKNRLRGHVFMPVFYKVKTGDVRKQTGKFGRYFEEYCKEISAGDTQIQTWKTALREAGSTSGWRLNDQSEAELIDKIVDHLLSNILRSSAPYLPEDVVPIESQVDEVISLLELIPRHCEPPVRVIGIHGNRGMGKTTLAGMVYNHVCFEFEGFSFLQLDDNADRDNLVHLQRKLLLDVFKINSPQFHDLRSNANEIKRKIRRRKLLLVLDNITSKDQVRHFGIEDRGRLLSQGSRVIITTRHRQVLDDLCVDDKYHVKKMGRSDSLRLFSRRVFGSDHPHEGFEELCESVLNIDNVRPSDLVDLASVLCGMVKEGWSEGIEKWKKNRKVFCRDLIQRVLSKRPIPHSHGSGLNLTYPIHDQGRMTFLTNPIRDFLNNVNSSANGLTTLLIGHPGGQFFSIPLHTMEGVLDTLSVYQALSIKLEKGGEYRAVENTERRNGNRSTMHVWISLFRKMGIVKPPRGAGRLTWERTNEEQPSRFTEDVEAQSSIPVLLQNSLHIQEEEPASDLKVEELTGATPGTEARDAPKRDMIY
ncbi:hypothetical protein MLD38_013730 [Melastoma candidum]|uniref:Uncharacterized protein n=1 Tax=Melastoma candidum TaxID=119954 RepID=A0ACB9R9X5_9MYRT|nr:hypothetical protein MLD38_013730 [Melastoma candidum]